MFVDSQFSVYISDYIYFLDSFTSVESSLKDSVSKVSVMFENKDGVDGIIEDFRLLMEDMERKIVYMDNVLLKER